jgi:outer membrane lipoprotein-sorting protein
MSRRALLGVGLGLSGSLLGAVAPAQLQKWLADVDATRNAFPEVVIRARATQVLDGKEQGSAEFEIYAKGRDRAVIVFRDPKNNGRKVLTVKERMWLIVPGTTNPVPITPNQRLLGGASFGDVAKLRFAEDFTAAERETPQTVAGRECRVLDLTATDARAPYPQVVLWVDSQDHLARKVLFFLPSGKEAKEALFTKFSKVAGKTVISEMEIRDLLGRESRTVTRLEYLDYRPARLDDAIFTPEGARGL